MAKTVRSVLLRAAKLVEKGWAQNGGAFNKKDEGVRPVSRAAVKWCAWGAIYRAVGNDESHLFYDAYAAFRSVVPDSSPIHWNDAPGRTANEVAVKLREAAR